MRRQLHWHPFAIPARLDLHARERCPHGLGLHHADRLPVDLQEVVSEAVTPPQRELAHGDASARTEVER